jgi:hypothetical protein
MTLSRDYLRPLRDSVILQVLILLPANVTADLGLLAQLAAMALAAYWVGALTILLRRSRSPTRLNLRAIRFGYPLVCFAALVVVPNVWSWRGIPL